MAIAFDASGVGFDSPSFTFDGVSVVVTPPDATYPECVTFDNDQRCSFDNDQRLTFAR